MTKEEIAEGYAEVLTDEYKDGLVDIDDISVLKEAIAEAYLHGLKAKINTTTISDYPFQNQWHDLRKDPNDLPTGTVDLDMYPDFMKSKVKPRIMVVAKICFKGYARPTPWADILYYEDGKWLELHTLQGKCNFFKEIPKSERVLAWYEVPKFGV